MREGAFGLLDPFAVTARSLPFDELIALGSWAKPRLVSETSKNNTAADHEAYS